MNDIYKNYSVVIPVREYNEFLKKCIKELLLISNLIEIIIVYDDIKFKDEIKRDYNQYLNNQIRTIRSKITTISAKRNYGTKLSNRRYIAFIDSDAYPDMNWINNSNTIFEENNNIYCVGGPNISPKNQKFINKCVGYAQKSFLVSGKWHYHKKIGVNQFVEHIPSCNMIIKREVYLKFNGMNENIYTGEDLDLCTRINDNAKRIYFSSNVVVYHFDRGIKNFLIQKIFRGLAVVDAKQKIINKLYLLIPMIFFLFNLISLISIILTFSILLNYFYIFIISMFLILCFYETIKNSNLKSAVIVFILIFLSIYLIGFGTITKYFKLGLNKKYYQNN